MASVRLGVVSSWPAGGMSAVAVAIVRWPAGGVALLPGTGVDADAAPWPLSGLAGIGLAGAGVEIGSEVEAEMAAATGPAIGGASGAVVSAGGQGSSARIARAALRPITTHSSSELLARRLAPCRPVQAASPRQYRPGMPVRPATSVRTPPQV